MKKILVILVALITLPTFAQHPAQIQKKVDRSNEAIQNPKRSEIPKTWLDRAEVFIELTNFYTKNLVQGMSISILGEPLSSKSTKAAGTEYIQCEYNDYTLYANQNLDIQFWETEKVDQNKSLDIAIESLEKMKSINKDEFLKRGKDVSSRVINELYTLGLVKYTLSKYEDAYSLFKNAVRTSELIEMIDTSAIYITGITAYEIGKNEEAKQYLEQLLSIGYDDQGNVQRTLAQAYYALEESGKSISLLEKAYEKYPNNAEILTLLIEIYSLSGRDPKEVIPIIAKAKELDPNNAWIYMTEATVWHQMGNAEKAIEASNKAIELDPNNFQIHFNLGVMYFNHGEALSKELNDMDLHKIKEMEAKEKELNNAFDQAITAFEAAHKINKKDFTTIDILRSLLFQKAGENEEMTKKYEYYNDLYEKLSN